MRHGGTGLEWAPQDGAGQDDAGPDWNSIGLDGTELDRTGLAAIGLYPEIHDKVKKVLV